MSKWLKGADEILVIISKSEELKATNVQTGATVALAFMLRHIIAEMEDK